MGCIEAMLWLSGEHLGPYWDCMGVKVWEMPRGLGAPGHKVWVPLRGLEVEGQKRSLTTRIGGSWGPEK
jgi:hypothetical protein